VYREVVSELAKKVETNESNNAWLARPPVNSAGPYEELRAAVAEVADESSAV